MTRTLVAMALLLTGAAVASAQTFVESTQVVVVEVPVQVTHDGEPVRGLTAADFEIYDGREKQTLTGFEAVDLTELGPDALAKGELPDSARRHFLLLFDLTFSDVKALVQARGAVRGMVAALHPTDLVAVGTWSVRQGPKLVLGFTADRRQIEAAIETLGIPDLLDNKPADPLRLALVEGQTDNFISGVDAGGGGGMKAAGDAEAAETLQRIADLSEEARTRDLRLAVRSLSENMADFAHIMGGIAGRKNVVFLSEGFDPALLEGSTDDAERRRQAETSAAGEIWNVRPGSLSGDTASLNRVERMLEELRRADCVVQAVDIAGLRGQGTLGGGKPAGQDMLLNIAKGTGGELYENTNDLGGAAQQMLRRTAVTYVLSFQPEKVGEPETFHKLRVEVKNQPHGTRVVHRPGWYAPKPYAARNPIEKVMSAASLLLGGEEGGPIQTALLAAPFRVEGGKAYVPVLLEIDGRSLLAGTPGNTLPAEVYVYALDAQGAVHGWFAQTIGLDVAKVRPALEQSGLKLFGHLDLPPGEYRLRSMVRNGVTGATTVGSRALTVPTFAEAGPVLLPPFFPEPTGKWLLVREAPRAGAREVPYPFLLGEEPYVPASLPVLVPGEPARLALVVYNLGTGAVRVRAKVLAAGGQEMAGGHLDLQEHRAGPPDRLVAAYDPPRLPPGTYSLQVTLTDGGGVSRTSSAPFVIGNTGSTIEPNKIEPGTSEKGTP